MRKFEGFHEVDGQGRTRGQGSFGPSRGAQTPASGLTLLAFVGLLGSCQPSVNASAEGPVQPQTPAPTETATAPAPEPTVAPTETSPAPIPVPTEEPTTVNPTPTSVPETTAAPTETFPTTLPTTIPTTFPTTLPTEFPTTLPPTETAPAPTTPTTPAAQTDGDRILLPGNIVFQTGKTVLMPTAENLTVLKQLQQFLIDNPKVTQIRVEGYTDNVGNPDSNLKLSGERALAIKSWLVSQGIPAERVLAVGFGQDKPIADNSTEAGRAQNRRTEFKIATVNGRAYRGVPVLGGGTEFK